MSDSSNAGNGIGCGMLFFAIFLVLKLTHVIAWSWWWVTAPIWAPAILGIIVASIAGVILMIAERNH
jgi:hypothetical protein